MNNHATMFGFFVFTFSLQVLKKANIQTVMLKKQFTDTCSLVH